MPRHPGNKVKLGIVDGHGDPLEMTPEMRSTHLYITGSTGTGKSKMLEYLIRQDISKWPDSKCGLLLIDPHGSLYDSLVNWIAWNEPHLKNVPIVPIDLRQTDWTVAYNFVGTLNISADAVRETMFHEIFHLNDAAHGSWSPGALGAIFDVVAKKCGTSIPCLAPYTPNETIVRGGTYYSFQPGNGVMEYAAELALRYYREQRAALRSLPKVKAFKCGPPENGRAWTLMKDEFFAGIDATPPCP